MGYLHLNSQKHEDIVSAEDIICLPCIFAEWKHRGRLFAHRGSCYWVTLDAVEFCNLVTEYGGPIWQHLHIFGILLVGAIEDRAWLINDVNWSTVRIDELCARTVKYASRQQSMVLTNRKSSSVDCCNACRCSFAAFRNALALALRWSSIYGRPAS